jgi:hypothetical protein
LAFFHPEAPAKGSQRMLTFAERVAYQRAIEEVYWRHRICPADRSDLKPSLDAVMSQAQLEKKVTDYLRESQALEDDWHQPITAEQLQTEIDRMAQHTKQPEVLRELFQSLGNDPFVIAECLARPMLTERLVADWSARAKRRRLEFGLTKALRSATIALTSARVGYTLPEISAGGTQCINNTWTATSTSNGPPGRAYHTSLWTGSEMIVWGGYTKSGYFNTGAENYSRSEASPDTSTAPVT